MHWKDPCLLKVCIPHSVGKKKVCIPHNILFINYIIYSIRVTFFFFVELSVFEDLEILDLSNNQLNGSETAQGKDIEKP